MCPGLAARYSSYIMVNSEDMNPVVMMGLLEMRGQSRCQQTLGTSNTFPLNILITSLIPSGISLVLLFMFLIRDRYLTFFDIKNS